MTKPNIYLAGTSLFLLAYIGWIINLVGGGIDELVTGYGLPVAVALMLVFATVLPTISRSVQSEKVKTVLGDIGELLKIGIIGGLLGSLAQKVLYFTPEHFCHWTPSDQSC
jgi:hypothetical protein